MSIRPGKKRRRTPRYQQPLAHAAAPNEVLSIDFKGWSRARNGERIDPLTLINNYSRYVLCRQGPGNAFPGEGKRRWEETRTAELERKVGRQTMEIDFLKGCLQRGG